MDLNKYGPEATVRALSGAHLVGPGRVAVVIDGQWGSTGKGKAVSFFALGFGFDFAVADFQPNAGHTVVLPDGRRFVTKMVPSSFVNPKMELFISPGASVDVDVLLDEVDMLDGAGFNVSERLIVDYRATLVEQRHKDAENDGRLDAVASTRTGGGAALADRVMRKAKTALNEPRLAHLRGDAVELVHHRLRTGKRGLVETAQGADLSVLHGFYPYTTSRDVSPGSALGNAGIPVRLCERVIGVLRRYPIRVGHLMEGLTKVGDSGPCYYDQSEITWENVEYLSRAPAGTLKELTTVTKRVRRVFTFSARQTEDVHNRCGFTDLFLNFVNHHDAVFGTDGNVSPAPESVETATPRVGEQKMADLLTFVQNAVVGPCVNGHADMVPKLRWLGTGPSAFDVIECTV